MKKRLRKKLAKLSNPSAMARMTRTGKIVIIRRDWSFNLWDKKQLLRWARWYERANRRVARTVVGNQEVSTIFLGVSQTFFSGNRPLWFETMVFPDGICYRYATFEQARKGHNWVVRELEERL